MLVGGAVCPAPSFTFGSSKGSSFSSARELRREERRSAESSTTGVTGRGCKSRACSCSCYQEQHPGPSKGPRTLSALIKTRVPQWLLTTRDPGLGNTSGCIPLGGGRVLPRLLTKEELERSLTAPAVRGSTEPQAWKGAPHLARPWDEQTASLHVPGSKWNTSHMVRVEASGQDSCMRRATSGLPDNNTLTCASAAARRQ